MIDWRIEELTGYQPITTYYMDFSIADKFGLKAIKQTYNQAKRDTISMGYAYLTELVLVLNWKIWEHYNKGNEEYARLYDSLWRELDNYCIHHLKNEELSYYYRVTD